jgi:hypothetical protein
MRTLFPDAGPADLLEIKRRQDTHLAREREALAGLWTGDRQNLSPGHSFLGRNRDLASGLILSLHQGPYQLLAEPFLKAGLEPAILLNSRAMESFKPGTEALVARLGYRTAIEWIPVKGRAFVRRLIEVVGQGRPVIIYLDGNTGGEGMAETRSRGMRYRLPGRDIRVRTGLARLVARLECPVHRVTLHWSDAGEPVWERETTLKWKRGDKPEVITRTLYDWCFSHVMRRPEQWQYWAMLKQSSACFGSGRLDEPRVPTGLREDFQRAYATCLDQSPGTVRLILEKRVAVWPGGVLADLTEDRFYPAAGLQDSDLEVLRTGEPTLKDLSAFHGESWVRFHGLRLCLLGMARLGG